MQDIHYVFTMHIYLLHNVNTYYAGAPVPVLRRTFTMCEQRQFASEAAHSSGARRERARRVEVLQITQFSYVCTVVDRYYNVR